MRTAKVIALHVGGLGNRIFNSGDTVTESNFPTNNFDRLINTGFLKEENVKVKQTKETAELEAKKPITLDNMDLGFGEGPSKKRK